MKLEDLLLWEYTEEELNKIWKWLEDHNIYGVVFEDIEFDPQFEGDYEDKPEKRAMLLDTAGAFEPSKIILKTFGYKGQEPKKTQEGNVEMVEEQYYEDFTLQDVLEELGLEFE